MLPNVPGWTVVADTPDCMTLASPHGADVAQIRYRPRRRPYATMQQVVDDALATCPALVSVEIEGPSALTTDEGEPAAIATIRGRLGDQPVEMLVGAVFLDDHYAELRSRCVSPDHFEATAAAVHTMIAGDTHALGIRRRRFQYDAPAGWTAHERSSLITDWASSSDESIEGHAVIRVFPANPRTSTGTVVASVLGATNDAGQHLDVDGPFDRIGAPVGCQLWNTVRRGDTPVYCDVAVLSDDWYEYVFVLESTSQATLEAGRNALYHMLDSMTPLHAKPKPVLPVPDGLFAQWAC